MTQDFHPLFSADLPAGARATVPLTTIARFSRWGATERTLHRSLERVESSLSSLRSLAASHEPLNQFFLFPDLIERGASVAFLAAALLENATETTNFSGPLIEAGILLDIGLSLLPAEMQTSAYSPDFEFMHLSRGLVGQQLVADLEMIYPGLGTSISNRDHWREIDFNADSTTVTIGICEEIEEASRSELNQSDGIFGDKIQRTILTYVNDDLRQTLNRSFPRLERRIGA